MNLVPSSLSRMMAGRAMAVRKNSPTILLGVGIVSMVGSTALACHATLKLDDVLTEIEGDKKKAALAKEMVEAGEAPDGTTYTDEEMANDLRIISVRGMVKVAKLYAPSIILGGIGIVCLTKSHQILKDRNAALTAAYIAVDTAFQRYRERVIDRFGEETDRDLRYDYEDIDVVDEQTGKVLSTTVAPEGDPGMYARWFDDTCKNFNDQPYDEWNYVWLRQQQNWANDLLRRRGHLMLNEVYSMIGLPHTKAGAAVGWVFDRNNNNGDNYVDFGCFDRSPDQEPVLFNGRPGAILLDFNVDGPIWHLLDELAQKKLEGK